MTRFATFWVEVLAGVALVPTAFTRRAVVFAVALLPAGFAVADFLADDDFEVALDIAIDFAFAVLVRGISVSFNPEKEASRVGWKQPLLVSNLIIYQ